MPLRNTASGSASLFVAAVILPLIFFLFSLSMDLRAYISTREHAQRTLDDAALYAYRYMNSRRPGPSERRPDTAVERARVFLEKHGEISSFTEIYREGDTLTLEFRGAVPFHFASLAARITGNDSSAVLPVTATSRVRGTVFDSIIAMDRSCYLAPSIFRGPDAAWGSESIWPASHLFTDTFSCLVSSGGRIKTVSPRIATQHCFNPFFSRIKTAASDMFNTMNSFSFNNVGLVFFPGEHGPITVARDLWRQDGFPEADFNPNPRVLAGDDGSITGDVADTAPDQGEPPDIVENRMCAAVAEDGRSPVSYRFPDRTTRDENTPGGSPGIISTEDWTYNAYAADQALRASDVIWSRPAFSSADAQNEPDTPLILESLLPVIFARGDGSDRGGLRNRAVRSILILAGDVPRSAGTRFGDADDSKLREALHRALGLYREWISRWNAPEMMGADPVHIHIRYIIFISQFSDLDVSQNRLESLREFFREESLLQGAVQDFFDIQLSAVTDQVGSGAILDMLMIQHKGGVLSL